MPRSVPAMICKLVTHPFLLPRVYPHPPSPLVKKHTHSKLPTSPHNTKINKNDKLVHRQAMSEHCGSNSLVSTARKKY